MATEFGKKRNTSNERIFLLMRGPSKVDLPGLPGADLVKIISDTLEAAGVQFDIGHDLETREKTGKTEIIIRGGESV